MDDTLDPEEIEAAEAVSYSRLDNIELTELDQVMTLSKSRLMLDENNDLLRAKSI